MAERRQAFRREPITTVTHDEKEHTAYPLPWQKANDLGDEIVRQNAAIANEMVRMFVGDEGLPQLEYRLQQKVSDWGSILVLAYPGTKPEDYAEYDVDECSSLIVPALEVNHLEHIRHLVDPNFQPPTLAGGNDTSAAGAEILLGQKIESMRTSSSEDSNGKPQELSVVENS